MIIIRQKLIDHFTDQISYYENRKKKCEKSLKDKERVGLPIDALDKLMIALEVQHINEYTYYLNKLNSMDDVQMKDFIELMLKDVDN